MSHSIATSSTPPRFTVGIDVGGTKTELTLAGLDGRAVRTLRQPTAVSRGPDEVLHELAQAVTTGFAAELPAVGAIGLAVAGQVDMAGVVQGAPNLGWTGVPARARLEQSLGLPVIVVNDVRAAAWAEWRLGAGQGCDDLVVVFIGTGIGGSVVSGGRMLEGYSNQFGELGHTTIVADGRQCHCRNRGCLEAYAAGWSIGERARLAAATHPTEAAFLLSLAGAPDWITAETVSDAAVKGDPFTLQLVEETGAYLGAAVVSFVNALNPRRVILGGGVIDGLPMLVEMAARAVRERALPAAADVVQVMPARLANHAPGLGAAVLARSLLGTPLASPTLQP